MASFCSPRRPEHEFVYRNVFFLLAKDFYFAQLCSTKDVCHVMSCHVMWHTGCPTFNQLFYFLISLHLFHIIKCTLKHLKEGILGFCLAKILQQSGFSSWFGDILNKKLIFHTKNRSNKSLLKFNKILVLSTRFFALITNLKSDWRSLA